MAADVRAINPAGQLDAPLQAGSVDTQLARFSMSFSGAPKVEAFLQALDAQAQQVWQARAVRRGPGLQGWAQQGMPARRPGGSAERLAQHSG